MGLRFSLATLMLFSFSAQLSVAQVELPNQPLLTAASVRPNVMLLFDNSFSMGTLVAPDYDEGAIQNCPEELALSSLQDLEEGDSLTIQVIVADDGVVQFRVNDDATYVWGNDGDVDATETDARCFKLGSNRYDVNYIDGDNETSVGESGHFWNYYFANNDFTGPDIWSDGIDRKPNVDSRISITRSAGINLVQTLRDIRLGFATFQTGGGNPGGTGARILNPIQDITVRPEHAAEIIENMQRLSPNGRTPLAEAFSDIARYFISGFEGQELTLHPGESFSSREVFSSDDDESQEVFATRPTYGFIDGVQISEPTEESPVITDACQRNYLVALTDGEPFEIDQISDLLYGTEVDGGSILPYDREAPFEHRLDPLQDEPVYQGGLDDVVLAMRDIDLRTDLGDKNNISSYFIGGFNTSLATDLIISRAAENGVDGGGSVFSANNRDELISSFDSIFEQINEASGSFSSVAFNAGAINTGTGVYQASFVYSDTYWSGDLRAFAFSTDDDSDNIFSDTASWSADQALSARVLAGGGEGHSTRNIITLSSAREGVPFRASEKSAFTEAMRADLQGNDGDTDLEDRVINYLRGAESEEFRERIPETFAITEEETVIIPADRGILGDIVNSSPIEVSAPELSYPDYDSGLTGVVQFGGPGTGGSYSEYVANNAERQSVVYVGANDGMLHAFNGNLNPADGGGEELFAYIPSSLADGSEENVGLFYLTSPTYQHDFYVDGELTASDVYIDPDGGFSPEWRTVLVGALGNGGRGLFALDVTEPSAFNESNADDIALWEFDGKDGTGDQDMGHVFGEPQIALMNNGSFAVIVGNGVNSDRGIASLFILFIEEGADGIWSVGDYRKITTMNVSDSDDINDDNGLFQPVLADLNDDQIVDRIYAGDLKGNLWVFNVEGNNPNNWRVAYDSAGEVGAPPSDPQPLYTAAIGSGDDAEPLPITTPPLVIRNEATPTEANGVNLLVLFGTGSLLSRDDFGDRTRQRFHAVWDRGTSRLTNSNLLERSISGGLVRTVSNDTPVDWFDGTDGHFGWFLNLGLEGERVIVPPTVLLNTILFTSAVPEESSCDAGGIGFLNAIGVDGRVTTQPVYDFDGDGDIDIDDTDQVSLAINDGIIPGTSLIGGGSASDQQPCPRDNGVYQAYTTSSGEVGYRWLCPDAASGLGRVAWGELFSE